MKIPLTASQDIKKDLSQRDIRLLERALRVLEQNQYDEVSRFFDGRTMICPGFRGIWNWDSAFHAIGVSRFDKQLAIDQIEGFFKYMLEDGMLPDLIGKDGIPEIHSSKPPVFAWATYEVYKNTGDIDFLRRMYDKLEQNESFWRTNRFDGKLFHYGAYLSGSEQDVLTWGKWESGWDNSIRWDDGIFEYYPVDLNCFMFSFYECMGKIAALIGKPNDEWISKAAELAALIEQTFWNEKMGAYTDYNRVTDQHSSALTPASFMPLFIKTASPERAERMAEIAMDKNKFNGIMPTASYDSTDFSNDYWRGPMWLNTAYFAAKGLSYYHPAVADTVKENILRLVDDIDDAIYENYDTVNRKGLYCKNFSWSACFVIELILNM